MHNDKCKEKDKEHGNQDTKWHRRHIRHLVSSQEVSRRKLVFFNFGGAFEIQLRRQQFFGQFNPGRIGVFQRSVNCRSRIYMIFGIHFQVNLKDCIIVKMIIFMQGRILVLGRKVFCRQIQPYWLWLSLECWTFPLCWEQLCSSYDCSQSCPSTRGLLPKLATWT